MREINWSNIAQLDYWDNIDVLQQKWTENKVRKFITKTEEVLNLLKSPNVSFKPTHYKNTFQVPITKHITFYYRIGTDNNIELLRFFKTYQNLNKLRFPTNQ